MKRTELINLLLSLNFEVVGHGSTIERIEEHMNFSNGDVHISLTDDNEHIYCVKSARHRLVGGYDGYEEDIPVSIDTKTKRAIEPYLLPEESIVEDIKNWKYEPYEIRLAKEIEEHNAWCKKHKLYDCMIKEK